MFSRIRETARILSYRENVVHPDLFGHREPPAITGAGRKIATVLQWAGAVVLGFIGAEAMEFVIGEVIPRSHMALGSSLVREAIASGLSVAAYSILDRVKIDAASRFARSIDLGPYFGHKIESVRRALKA